MSLDAIPPLGPRPVEAVQPHRRIHERREDEREPPERRGSEPGEEERDEGADDDEAPRLDVRI
ncbi:MAG: hypothetical protein IRZ20_09550 [Thermoleophilia bacterium]|nr:hypothetical protein [Thermoleophilia bacterium]